jgi:hypothetical protein
MPGREVERHQASIRDFSSCCRSSDPLFNTIVTNVPGSPEPLHFAGATMRHYDAWGPVWDGLGIIHPVKLVSIFQHRLIEVRASLPISASPSTHLPKMTLEVTRK